MRQQEPIVDWARASVTVYAGLVESRRRRGAWPARRDCRHFLSYTCPVLVMHTRAWSRLPRTANAKLCAVREARTGAQCQKTHTKRHGRPSNTA